MFPDPLPTGAYLRGGGAKAVGSPRRYSPLTWAWTGRGHNKTNLVKLAFSDTQ